jgi:gamma-glutamyltranspeptidase/glutathione hydrolase
MHGSWVLLLLVVLGTPDTRAASYSGGAVAAVSPPAVDVGVAILAAGGNAVDAAVAVGLAQAVTYPAAGNLGGGGFMLVHPGGGKPPVVIDYRETAPAAATADLFAQVEDYYSHRAVGVPGTVRGFALAHKQFGKLPWKDVVAPASKLADGFALNASLAASLNGVVASVPDEKNFVAAFGKDGGKGDWQPGDVLRQPDLAKTLRLIADQGPDAFYTGPIADLLVAEMQRGKGLITKADLAKYEAKLREPIHGTYRGYDVYGPPPPSSGGICLVQMLNMLEPHDLSKLGPRSPATVHLLAETMKRAFADRARYLGDPDFVPIPPKLITKEYAKELAATINLERATPADKVAPELPITAEGNDTTHYSVVDGNGMAVSNTYTLERSYGTRIVVAGAGFLLNNEMMDFNPKPGVTDRTGRIGTPPNRIAPGKRMLSSQTPTILAKDGKAFLVTGSPGSRTIINTVLCVVTNVVDFKMSIQDAVDAPRIHHQWLPDELRLEQTKKHEELVTALTAKGHRVTGTRQGDAHSIWIDPQTGQATPAADKRLDGKAAGR